MGSRRALTSDILATQELSVTALSDVHHDDVPTGEGHVRLSRDRGQGDPVSGPSLAYYIQL